MRQVPAFQEIGDVSALFDRPSTNQHGLARSMPYGRIGDDGVQLCLSVGEETGGQHDSL